MTDRRNPMSQSVVPFEGFLAISTFCFIVLAVFVDAWVLTILWGWFVVPFFKVPPLTLAYAVGFSVIVSFLTACNSPQNKELPIWAWLILKPTFALGIGYVAAQFV